MASKSILAGLLDSECLDPDGENRLLVELVARDQAACQALADQLGSQPCQQEWHHGDDCWSIYILAEPEVDHNRFLSTISRLIDGAAGRFELIESRLVQRAAAPPPRHSFRFVEAGPKGPRDLVLGRCGQAFGSGNHPSTNLVVELLEELPTLASPVLDVGCGTGVLALVAARLGATSIVGVDIDSQAVAMATANARANDLAVATFTTTPLAEITGAFPLILANLTASVFVRLLAHITARAESGGQLIVSGLQGRQGNEAEAAAARHGWSLVTRRCQGKWQARLFTRAGEERGGFA